MPDIHSPIRELLAIVLAYSLTISSQINNDMAIALQQATQVTVLAFD